MLLKTIWFFTSWWSWWHILIYLLKILISIVLLSFLNESTGFFFHLSYQRLRRLSCLRFTQRFDLDWDQGSELFVWLSRHFKRWRHPLLLSPESTEIGCFQITPPELRIFHVIVIIPLNGYLIVTTYSKLTWASVESPLFWLMIGIKSLTLDFIPNPPS